MIDPALGTLFEAWGGWTPHIALWVIIATVTTLKEDDERSINNSLIALDHLVWGLSFKFSQIRSKL